MRYLLAKVPQASASVLGPRVALHAAMLVASTDQLPQDGGRVTILGLHDQGRSLDLTLGRWRSITLTRRRMLQLEPPSRLVALGPGATHAVDTARPDQLPMAHPMRCTTSGTATAGPAEES